MIHIHPLNDDEPHDLESTMCHCGPEIKIEDGEMIVVHNSFDRREIIEEAERIKLIASGS